VTGQRLVLNLSKINGDQRFSVVRALTWQPQAFDE
jgi:hypothetical protein